MAPRHDKPLPGMSASCRGWHFVPSVSGRSISPGGHSSGSLISRLRPMSLGGSCGLQCVHPNVPDDAIERHRCGNSGVRHERQSCCQSSRRGRHQCNPGGGIVEPLVASASGASRSGCRNCTWRSRWWAAGYRCDRAPHSWGLVLIAGQPTAEEVRRPTRRCGWPWRHRRVHAVAIAPCTPAS